MARNIRPLHSVKRKRGRRKTLIYLIDDDYHWIKKFFQRVQEHNEKNGEQIEVISFRNTRVLLKVELSITPPHYIICDTTLLGDPDGPRNLFNEVEQGNISGKIVFVSHQFSVEDRRLEDKTTLSIHLKDDIEKILDLISK